ncbi:GYD domain-containing protein [Streptomyces sp. NBC_01456]|uniref:GYD domain-containing protein n=1 Tax=unclassified Streptomyces TaxID=2593676 RepID=UPI002E2EE597|nr:MULTISPECIES: GYD domain-containing protein [unclassified Streptomyces]
MPKFLIQAAYASDGVKGLLKEGASGHRAAVDQVVTDLGGKVESVYFTFGENDIVIILDFPDPVSMAAIGLAVKASGALHTEPRPSTPPRRSTRPPPPSPLPRPERVATRSARKGIRPIPGTAPRDAVRLATVPPGPVHTAKVIPRQLPPHSP